MDTIEVRPANWSFIQKLAFRLFSIFFILYMLLCPNGAIQIPFFEKLFRLYVHLFEGIANWLGGNLFNLKQPLNNEGSGSGDTTMQYLFLLITWLIAIVGSIVWSIADAKRRNYNRALYWVSVCIRFYLATTMISYGAAKLFKTQFPYPSYYRLTQPYGNSSPMGLAWTFFGFSLWYNYFMGIAEVLGGALLFFRRTTTLGALVTFSVSANIMAVNYSFDVPVKILSTILVAMSLFLLAKDIKRLIAFFILNKNVPAAGIAAYVFKKRWANITLIVLKYLMIINVVGGTIQNSLYMKKITTSYAQEESLYGNYNVIANQSGASQKPDTNTWRKLTVRYDSVKITLADNSSHTYPFNLDRERKQIGIFTSKQDTMPAYILNYNLSVPNKATLDAIDKGKINLKAIKASQDSFLLMTRGFHWINEVPNNK